MHSTSTYAADTLADFATVFAIAMMSLAVTAPQLSNPPIVIFILNATIVGCCDYSSVMVIVMMMVMVMVMV